MIANHPLLPHRVLPNRPPRWLQHGLLFFLVVAQALLLAPIRTHAQLQNDLSVDYSLVVETEASGESAAAAKPSALRIAEDKAVAELGRIVNLPADSLRQSMNTYEILQEKSRPDGYWAKIRYYVDPQALAAQGIHLKKIEPPQIGVAYEDQGNHHDGNFYATPGMLILPVTVLRATPVLWVDNPWTLAWRARADQPAMTGSSTSDNHPSGDHPRIITPLGDFQDVRTLTANQIPSQVTDQSAPWPSAALESLESKYDAKEGTVVASAEKVYDVGIGLSPSQQDPSIDDAPRNDDEELVALKISLVHRDTSVTFYVHRLPGEPVSDFYQRAVEKSLNRLAEAKGKPSQHIAPLNTITGIVPYGTPAAWPRLRVKLAKALKNAMDAPMPLSMLVLPRVLTQQRADVTLLFPGSLSELQRNLSQADILLERTLEGDLLIHVP